MAVTSLPPGFRFHPTDVELFMYYLKRKVLGKKIPVDAIAEVNIYNFPPWDLKKEACPWIKDLKWYFFCPRVRKYATGSRTKRSTEFGFWKTTGKDRLVIYNGRPVGMIKSLIFHRQGSERNSERTDWVMHEYRLEDEDLKTKGVAQDEFVICMIYQKDGLGPRNGAQYGAPYNEEEWDDEEEADVPCTCSFPQAFMLPDNQNQTVDIRITGSEQYCGGSTSKACPVGPSQIVPSVVNVPPPALPNDVTMEDPQNLCDEYLLSNGMFGDEILAASSENDIVENLDHINPDGNHQAEHPVDDIYDGLEDLGGSLAPCHHNNNVAVTHSDANILALSEAFMELKDFDAPLASVNERGPSGQNHSDRYLSAYDHATAAQSLYFDGPLTSAIGPGPSGDNQSDRYFSAYDHSIAAQSFWTPVIPDDANASGLGLEDLENPLTCFTEATQSNRAGVDASFHYLGGNEGLGGFGTSNPPAFAQSFHGSEVTHIAEDSPWLSQHLQSELFQGYVDNCQEGYGVEECTNQEIVRYGAGAAASPINNLDLGCAHACENSGRGRSQLW